MLHLFEEIVQIELVLPKLLFHFQSFFFGVGILRMLDQAHHIAHSQDSGSDSIRMERLQSVVFLAGTHELDWLARYALGRKCRTASGITVHLGHHDAIHTQGFVEAGGDVHRILTGESVYDQQNLVRADVFLELFQLIHQLLINLQSAGSIHDQYIAALVLRRFHRSFGDFHRVGGFPHGEYRSIHCFSNHFQLIDRRRTVHVAGTEHRFLSVLFQVIG